MEFHCCPMGDSAIVIEVGEEIDRHTHQKVKEIVNVLENTSFDWLIEYVPAFTTVTLFYNPIRVIEMRDVPAHMLPYEYVVSQVEQLLGNLPETVKDSEARIVEIPVIYGGDYGPDLEYVAQHNQLTTEEVINIHTEADYLVYMIGFAPGFPYIGGMSGEIAAPRKESPRMKIPAGSVGIAGEQTGIYPIETPGGWQLIGKTPVRLFRPEEKIPSLLRAGDKIRFKSISKQEYEQWEEGI